MLKHNSQEVQEILSQYVNDNYREFLERNYYGKTNELSKIDNLMNNNVFLEKPQKHVALFDDHGIIHVRNIAMKILAMLEELNGVLIDRRNRIRLEYMKGYGILVAYLHDAGMCKGSMYGRVTHAEFIAHELYHDHFIPIIDEIWQHNELNLRTKITYIIDKNQLTIKGKTFLREMLALAYCHSKSSVPAYVLDNLQLLYEKMQRCLSTTLSEKYLDTVHKKNVSRDDETEITKNLAGDKKKLIENLAKYYDDFSKESYSWLLLEGEEDKQFIHDLIDTLRILRCADALRQRGTTLKTSGSYPIFLDTDSANSIYSFYTKNGDNILLEIDNPINSGEANIAASEVTRQGDLKFSFFVGNFKTKEVAVKSAKNVALIIDDVQKDVIDSLQGTKSHPKKRMNILIEQTNDNYKYAETILKMLVKQNPVIKSYAKVIPNIENVPLREQGRYFNSEEVGDWPIDKLRYIISKMEETGLKKNSVNPEVAFNDARYFILQPNENLFDPLEASEFTYIPFNDGLEGIPNGGYSHFAIKPWTFVGHLGVIRKAERNATVIATKPVPIIMIRRSTFISNWYHPYTEDEFVEYLKAYKHE